MDGNTGNVIDRKRINDIDTSCYYRGHVMGVKDSHVTISTCEISSNDNNNVPHPLASKFDRFRSASLSSPDAARAASGGISLRGVIMIPNEESIFIEPAQPHSTEQHVFSSGDHLLYRSSDYQSHDVTYCGVDAPHDHHLDSHSGSNNNNNNIPTESPPPPTGQYHSQSLPPKSGGPSLFHPLSNGNVQKYVESWVFNDVKRWNSRGSQTHELSKQIMNQVATLYTNPRYAPFSCLHSRHDDDDDVILVIPIAPWVGIIRLLFDWLVRPHL